MEKKIVNNKIRKNGRPKGLTLGQILTWSVGEFHVYVGPNKWRTFKTKEQATRFASWFVKEI